MKALQVTALEGPDAIMITETSAPDRLPEIYAGSANPITIAVHAAGVSFPEVLQARGKYQFKAEPPFTPGSEVAGIVESAPEGSRFKAGDRVAAYSFVGGLAESVIVPERATFALSEKLSFSQGAALVMNYHTAYFALVTRARLKKGDRVLVQGAAGGVGTATIQVAKGLGAEVIAIVSSDEKEAVVREAGADHVFRSTGSWLNETLATFADGVDIVIDPVGGDRLIDNLRVLAESGRFVIVGFADGQIPQIPSNRLLLKNIDAVGAMWGGYMLAHPEYPAQVAEALSPLIESGHIRPIIGAEFEFEQGAEAFRHIEARKALGKVVVTVR